MAVKTSNVFSVTVPAVTQPGSLSFLLSSYSMDENTSLNVPVQRTGGSDGAVAVNWALTGTSHNQSGTLNWASGNTANKNIALTVGEIAANENGTITLSSPTNGATLGSPSTTALIIVNLASGAPRILQVEIDFESGQFQSNSYKEGGIFKDGWNVKQSSRRAQVTITGITNTNPAIATYSGTRIQNGDGVTFGKTGGIVQLRDRLVRAKNTSATQFECWWDGAPGFGNPEIGWNNNPVSIGKQACDTEKQYATPNNATGRSSRVDARNYGTFGANTTGDLWFEHTIANGISRAAGSVYDVKVVQGSYQPPANLIGPGGAPVPPLRGNYYMSTEIFFDRDHAMFQGNNFKNKPRFTISTGAGNDPGRTFGYNQEAWMSISYFLPENFHHDPEINEAGNTNMIQTNSGNNDLDNFWHMMIWRYSGTSSMNWHTEVIRNNTAFTEYDLGNTVADGDIGKWTTFIWNCRPHATTGFVKIYKSKGPYVSGLMRNIYQVLNVTGGAGFTFSVGKVFAYGFRQYKHGWHHNQNSMNSKSQWIGWDEIRWGLASAGTRFRDVDPWQRTGPDG